MKFIYSHEHRSHDPQQFMVRGQLKRSNEQPERAEILLRSAQKAGHQPMLVEDFGAGPRADWFEASALASLFDEPWLVTNDSNRVGMRLAGPALARARGGELPSEGMVVGAMQVPPSGQPTVLLADGPVTGGYPVIAVVAEASLDRLAQARPGQRVRFRHAQP